MGPPQAGFFAGFSFIPPLGKTAAWTVAVGPYSQTRGWVNRRNLTFAMECSKPIATNAEIGSTMPVNFPARSPAAHWSERSGGERRVRRKGSATKSKSFLIK